MNDKKKKCPLEIREKLKEKRRLRKSWQRTLYPLDKLAFNRASKEFKIMIAKNKIETLQNYLAKLSPQGDNEYSVWKATKHLKRSKTFISPLKTIFNTWGRTSSEKAETFALHLANVLNSFPQTCQNLVKSEIEEFLCSPLQLSSPIKLFSVKEIKQIIENERNKKSLLDMT